MKLPTNLQDVSQLVQHNTTMQLFCGVGVVLMLASVVGLTLKKSVAKGQAHAVIDNLNARINAWWIMVGALALAFALGKHGVIVMFTLISLFAMREYLAVAKANNENDRVPIRIAFWIVLPLQYGLIWISWYGLYSIFIPIYAFLVLPIVGVLTGKVEGFLHRTATVQWGVMVCVFCISHVPALLTLDVTGYTGSLLLLIAWLVLVVQGSDVLQYVWGKLMGKHKVAPELSPSKTWEGLIGGVASATALGTSLYWITPFAPWQAAGLALIVCLMGFFGGLVMSAIKRDRNVKDWGNLIDGHGGMLDRLDSIVFAAPVYFHAIRYWWTP